MRPLACGLCAAIQTICSSPDLRRRHRLAFLPSQRLVVARHFRRRLEQARLVRVERHGPSVLLQIHPQQPHVLGRRIVLAEPRRQFACGIVDHRDQIEFRAPAFQPVVLAGVPLHQLASTAAPRPPHMHVFDLLQLRTPQSGCHHHLPQRLASDPDLVIFRQVIAGQRRPEIAPLRLRQGRYCLLPHRLAQLPV
jgi:hypothetical protein